MAGTWNVIYEMERGPSQDGGGGEGTMTARLGPAGQSLVLDFKATSGPTAGFEVHQVIAWNPDRKAYDVFWVDSYNPGVVTAEGEPDGGQIVYTRESVRGDIRMVTQGVLSPVVSDTFTVTNYLSLDGGPHVKTLTLSYHRK